MVGDGESGSWWRVLPRVAAGIVSVPVVLAFVALGTVVIVGRSVRDVARVSLARRSRPDVAPPVADGPDADTGRRRTA